MCPLLASCPDALAKYLSHHTEGGVCSLNHTLPPPFNSSSSIWLCDSTLSQTVHSLYIARCSFARHALLTLLSQLVRVSMQNVTSWIWDMFTCCHHVRYCSCWWRHQSVLLRTVLSKDRFPTVSFTVCTVEIKQGVFLPRLVNCEQKNYGSLNDFNKETRGHVLY